MPFFRKDPMTRDMCPADGSFPAVDDGKFSLSFCPDGFTGFSYRLCTNGVLGEVQIDRCEYKPPSGLAYANSSMECMIDVEVTSGMPTYTNFVTEFHLEGEASLPEGLVFNSTTGEIRGVPPATLDARAFTVCVKNPAGEACTEITITVEKRDYCEASDGFERTKVGETAVYNCWKRDRQVGKRTRECVMRGIRGEWLTETGYCVSVGMFILYVVLIVFDVIMVCICIMAFLSHVSCDC